MMTSPRNNTSAFFVWLCMAIMVFGCASTAVSQTSRCEFGFTGCLSDFNGKTLVVSDDIVALTAKVKSCTPTKTTGDTSSPPAVMFVIDHSGSMSWAANPNDRNGARFIVASGLVDSIYKVSPAAEVGLVVFREMLYFDTSKTNPDFFYRKFFIPLNNAPSPISQSYLMLLKLDSTYATSLGNKLGLDIVKEVLKTKITNSNGASYTDLIYKPSFTTAGGTNITVAFDAAKQGFKQTTIKKERQFIVFISDGEAKAPSDNNERLRFLKGDTTPTTYTVFFSPDSTPSDTLKIMTQNIRTNGYSTTNDSSKIFALKVTDTKSLMILMMNSIMKTVLSVSYGKANQMQINTIISSTTQDSFFLFQNRYPLNADTTRLKFLVNYSYFDSTRMKQIDTFATTNILVKRQPGAALDPGISKSCWGLPTLDIYYRDQPIVGPIYETMDTLEYRFSSGLSTLNAASLIVTTQVSQDTENVGLVKNGSYWSIVMPRSINSFSTKGDKKIQNAMTDSIVCVYRNPLLPLDTIRIAKPFRISKAIHIQNATIFDKNADGYFDSIFVSMSGIFDAADIDRVKSGIQLPAGLGLTLKTLTISGNGLGLSVRAAQRNTKVSISDKIAFSGFGDPLPHGGLLIDTSVTLIDKAAPVILRARVLDDGSVGDTLVIVFTEKTNGSFTAEPFKFMDTSKTLYSVFISSASGTDSCRFVIQSISQGKINIQRGDSIWINPAGAVTDTAGVIQINPDNRKVVLTVDLKPYSVRIQTSNNPFNANAIETPIFVKDVIDRIKQADPSVIVPRNGIALRVAPDSAKVDPVTLRNITRLEGYVSIFDVVQNVILKKTKCTFVADRKELLYVWDGRNTQGRLVANGTYYAVLEVSGDQGYKTRQIKALGIKR